MKKNLILPIAGESSRYAGTVPKWALKHPRGTCMLTEAIRGLELKVFDRILLVGLKYYKKFVEQVSSEMEQEYGLDVDVLLLDKQTDSQPETVYKAIQKADVKGAILIKDCDGSFKYSPNWDVNHVAVGDLNDVGKINAGNKSYVKANNNKTLGNIAEKRVISNLFNVGAYYFTSSEEFCRYYNSISTCKKELYISHIIYKMLLDGKIFFIEQVSSYRDWGTQRDWNEYKNRLAKDKSIVIDLDGTIAELSDKPYEKRKKIKRVVDKIWEYKKKGFYITIFTSRQMNTFDRNIGIINKKTAPVVLDWLQEHNVPFDEIYFGRPWCGHNGFYVCDKTVSPDVFVSYSYDKIMEMLN